MNTDPPSQLNRRRVLRARLCITLALGLLAVVALRGRGEPNWKSAARDVAPKIYPSFGNHVGQVVVNGGFEQGFAEPWGIRVDTESRAVWTNRGGCRSQAEADKKVFHGGQFSLRIVNRSPRANGRYGETAQPIVVEPDRSYRISLWVRARSLASDGAVTVRIGLPHHGHPTEVVPIQLSRGTYQWTRLTGTFSFPATVAELVIRTEDAGEVWIDDIQVEPVGPVGAAEPELDARFPSDLPPLTPDSQAPADTGYSTNSPLPADPTPSRPDTAVRPAAPRGLRTVVDAVGHNGYITRICVSPDGTQLISASEDKTIRFWDVKTGQPGRVLRPPNGPGAMGQIFALAISPDGRTLAVGGSMRGGLILGVRCHKTISAELQRFLNLPDRNGVAVAAVVPGTAAAQAGLRAGDVIIKFGDQRLRSRAQLIELLGRSRLPRSAALTILRSGKPLTRKVILPETCRAGRFLIDLISLPVGRIERVLSGHTDTVLDLAFSPDGRWLASASRDGTARLWDAKDGRQLYVLKGHTQAVNAVAFSPSSDRLATASEDGIARIWSVETGRSEAVLKGHAAGLRAIDWSPDGRTIATGDAAHSVRLWNADGSWRRGFNQLGLPVHFLRFAPDARRLLLPRLVDGHPCCVLLDIQTGEQPVRFAGHPVSISTGTIFPDGRWAATAGGDNREIAVWKTDDAALVRHFQRAPRAVWSAAWSSDGRRIAWGNQRHAAPADDNRRGPLLETFDLEQLQLSLPPDGTFRRTRPNTAAVSLVRAGQTLQVHRDGQLIRRLEPGDGGYILCYSLLSDDTAVVGTSFGLYLFDLRSGKLLREYFGHADSVLAVSPSPDGRYLLSACQDGVLRIWNVNRSDPLLSLLVVGRQWVIWTPNGYYAASPNGDALIGWVLDRGHTRMPRFYPGGSLRSSLYRPDLIGKVLSSGDVDRLAGAEEDFYGPASHPAPADDAEMLDLPVAARAETRITAAEGGRLELPDGAAVSIPAGAVTADIKLTARKLHLAGPESHGNAVYRFELEPPQRVLQHPATLTFPFRKPGRASSREPRVKVAVLQPGAGWIEVPATVDYAAGTATVQTKHFSTWRIFFTGFWQFQARDRSPVILSVPYYPQGDSGWCWAACMQMMLKYYGYDLEIWDIAKAFEADYNTPLNAGKFMIGRYTSFFEKRGFEVERSLLGWLDRDELTGYIMYHIRNRRPVWLALPNVRHVVLVVGFDEQGIYVNDSSGALVEFIRGAAAANRTDPNHVRLSWDEWHDVALAKKGYRGAFTKHTLVLLNAARDRKPAASLAVLSGHVGFRIPESPFSSGRPANYLQWDGTKPHGHVFTGLRPIHYGTADNSPGNSDSLFAFHASLANGTHVGLDAAVQLLLDDKPIRVRRNIPLPPRTSNVMVELMQTDSRQDDPYNFQLDPIKPGPHRLRADLYVGGAVVDSTTIHFTMGPGKPLGLRGERSGDTVQLTWNPNREVLVGLADIQYFVWKYEQWRKNASVIARTPRTRFEDHLQPGDNKTYKYRVEAVVAGTHRLNGILSDEVRVRPSGGFLKGDSKFVDPRLVEEHISYDLCEISAQYLKDDIYWHITKYPDAESAREAMRKYAEMAREAARRHAERARSRLGGLRTQCIDRSTYTPTEVISDLSERTFGESSRQIISGSDQSWLRSQYLYRDIFIIFWTRSGLGFEHNFRRQWRQVVARCRALIDKRFPP